MWVYDFETLKFINVNEAAVRHYGFSKDEFLNLTIADIRPPEELPMMLKTLSTLHDRDRNRIFRHRKKDGTVIDVDIRRTKIDLEGRPAYLAVLIDVTNQRRSERALRETADQAGEVRTAAKGIEIEHHRHFSLLGFGQRLEENSRPHEPGFLRCEEHNPQAAPQLRHARSEAFEYSNRCCDAGGIVQSTLPNVVTVIMSAHNDPFGRLARNFRYEVNAGRWLPQRGNAHADPHWF